MNKQKLFLASSSELKPDRDQFEIFIGRKNKDWVGKGVFLELHLWEDFLDAMSQTRLQDEYKKVIAECDIFVMLFWTKVGKYTEEEFEHAFKQFKATSKPFIFTYFKDAPHTASRENLTSLWAFQDKLEALGHFQTVYPNIEGLLLHFSQQLDKLAAKGFIEFKPNAGQAAAGTAYDANVTGSGAIVQGGGTAVGGGGVFVGGKNTGPINTGTQIDTGGGHFIGGDFIQIVAEVVRRSDDPDEAKSVIAHYLHALAADLAGLKLGGIDPSAAQPGKEPLQLADVYVPLDTHLHIPQDTTLLEWLAQGQHARRADPAAEREMRPVPALEALAAHRELTVLGKPGSGKSTFGAHVLLALAQVWQGHQAEIAQLGQTWTYGPLLPIRVILRHFADQLPPGDKPARAGDMWAFIGRDVQAAGYGLPAETMKYIERLAREHGAMILLDGLDECGNDATRQRVLAAVEELKRSAGPKCRFLLTARPYAWPDGPDPARGVYALADLDGDKIEQFIRAWYAALVTRQWLPLAEADRKQDDLLEATQRRDLRPLTANPLLLTLMATLHTNRGRLPDDRVDLYDDSVHLLLLRWNEQIDADRALLDALNVPGLTLPALRETLEELAFKVHEQHVGREGAADIGEGRLARAFCPLLANSKDKADLVVDYIEKRAGLLIGQGEKDGERQFTFPHRTFQEFLAACHLASQADLNERAVRLAQQDAGHWKEVLVLTARQARAGRGASLADAMIGGEAFDPASAESATNTDFVRALIAAEQLLEIGLPSVGSSRPRDAARKRVATWLVGGLQALKQVPEPPGRAYLGDLLSDLGDPRFDPQRFHLPADPLLGFVRIPSDPEFRIGTRGADRQRVAEIIDHDVPDDEINDAPTPTPEFYIARYPVTVAQFRAFVEARQFKPGDDDALRDPDSRPVRWVSWHEARAYCEGLHEALANSPEFDGSEIARLIREEGWRVSLPSELEWEKAARGGLVGAVFSWGDAPDPNRANYGHSGIETTSAVGCFPANGYGLYDMIGNVWEWTRSLWGENRGEPAFVFPYRSDDPQREALDAGDDVFRVVRGGSWLYDRDFARCAVRLRYRPVLRYDHLGFRMVLRSAPVLSSL